MHVLHIVVVLEGVYSTGRCVELILRVQVAAACDVCMLQLVIVTYLLLLHKASSFSLHGVEGDLVDTFGSSAPRSCAVLKNVVAATARGGSIVARLDERFVLLAIFAPVDPTFVDLGATRRKAALFHELCSLVHEKFAVALITRVLVSLFPGLCIEVDDQVV